ncbi:probable tubulin polyglutamylase TTLL9 [Schistocerca piceifrons]|uniref:probable tubulin polyglutamylase TTLL9 n=1 Tax=Schistocerca piceifrons TaxID=274613 RepID=UPI001F5FEDD4|nr:probable tubulin polyglutamylase TTLL9 [Schistocerca piceifrons]
MYSFYGSWCQVEFLKSNWDLCWCDPRHVETAMAALDPVRRDDGRRVCHFRNHYELTRKNLLSRNLSRLRRRYVREGGEEKASLCDIMPLTFELPGDYKMFTEHHRKNPEDIWIVKPVTGSQGRGIFLFKRLQQLREWLRNREPAEEDGDSGEQSRGGTTHIVQRYVHRPSLVAGRKFDLRIYVLVTSFCPLKVWVAREGFARVCTHQFSLEHLDDKLGHLTNTTLRLRNDPSDTFGSKWPLMDLRQWVEFNHGKLAIMGLVHDAGRLVLTALTAAQTAVSQDPHCFELYGFDILIDADLRLWLLEVNASPSLAPSDADDQRLKHDLLQDVFNILDFEGKLTGKERRVGGFDLLCNGEPLWAPVPGGRQVDTRYLNLYLGCENNRQKQLLEIWSKAAKTRSTAVK